MRIVCRRGRCLVVRLSDCGKCKIEVAGGVGAGAGVLIGAVKGQPALRFGVAVGTNFLVAASCFCGNYPWQCFPFLS